MQQEYCQRIYKLGSSFSDVAQAKVEPQGAGVIVIFDVKEEPLIRAIHFKGNNDVTSEDLQKEMDIQVGQSIESFRISLAKRAILRLYKSKNFPFAHVDLSMDDLTRTGDAVFKITQGPKVTPIRKIRSLYRRATPTRLGSSTMWSRRHAGTGFLMPAHTIRTWRTRTLRQSECSLLS